MAPLMHRVLLLLSLACMLCFRVMAQSSSGSEIGTEALDRFWQIADTLEKGTEPSEEAWLGLFYSRAYKHFLVVPETRNQFAESMRLVFSPGNKIKLDSALASDDLMVEHLFKVRAMRVEIEQRARTLSAIRGMVSRARARACALLPDCPDEVPPVEVGFIGNAMAAPSAIVFDVSIFSPEMLEDVLAHELHHWYRQRQCNLSRDSLSWHEFVLGLRLDYILGEGIASMVSKSFEYPDSGVGSTSPRFSHPNIQSEMDHFAEFVQTIDRTLHELS